MPLAPRVAAFAEWRTQLAARIGALQDWLHRNELAGPQTAARLTQLQARLRDDQLTIAFVAEFSRGKSELINAMFFSGYGCRILPSSVGRTTMCPTELAWDPALPPQLALLPITTRGGERSLAEWRADPGAWQTQPLDTESGTAMQAALRQVGETLAVTVAEAQALGFPIDGAGGGGYLPAADGRVEIPRWRHALINFPHPLLQQGLVILDTPGLNAVGTEPELTLSLLPQADALLFLLAADTGVTQSDLSVWLEHMGSAASAQPGRLVVLNKIDSLWDELKSAAEVEADIAAQAANCAALLKLDVTRIYPVSAQKALVGRITGDAGLLQRSRVPQLEEALSQVLIPARRKIVSERVTGEFAALIDGVRSLQAARLSGLNSQLAELVSLRGKNQGVIEYMLGQVRSEKEAFEAGLQRYTAVRSVFTAQSNALLAHLAIDRLRQLAHETRATMLEASFSRVLSEAMDAFFAEVLAALAAAGQSIGEIDDMMSAIYRKFAAEHGLRLGTPPPFSLTRYSVEIERLQAWCDRHLNTMLALLLREKGNITQKFFEEVAIQVRRAFEQANRDVELWLRAVMAPVEMQVREHQTLLRRRLDSIRRIHQATDSLEERISEFEATTQALTVQLATLDSLADEIQGLLHAVDAG